MTEEERNDQWKQFGLPDEEMEWAGRDELVRVFNLACLIGYPEKARLARSFINGAFDQSLALRGAAEKGHLGILKMMQEIGLDVRAENDVALMNAACFGRTDCVKWLLEQGADPSSRGGASLELAAGNDHAVIVRMLLKAGGFEEQRLQRALWQAITNENAVIAGLVLEACADRTQTAGEKLAHEAMRSSGKMIPFLLASGADVRHDGDLALYNAIKARRTENVAILLAAGAEPMARQGEILRLSGTVGDDEIYQTLLAAAETRKEEARRGLAKLPQAASLEILRSAAGQEGYNVLALAARIGDAGRLLRQTVANGESLTAGVLLQGKSGRSALDVAIDYGTWRDLFDPLLWSRRPVEMQKLWQALPEQQQRELSWETCLFNLDQKALRSRVAPRLSRGPQP